MAIREASNLLKLLATVVIVFLTVVNRIAAEAEVREEIEERGERS
jgi:hypothetical protein